ncbi:MAG: hypothetical protein JSV16_01440, partial [Candidatus Hydrogenedentota bacterium]
EMPMTFFVVGSLSLMVKFVDLAQRGQLKEGCLWCAVVLGGLAAGIKYNGAAILLVVPLAMWVAGMPFRRSLRRLPLAAVLSVAVFVATTPYAILDPRTFLDLGIGMPYDFVHYSTGHPGADQGIGFPKAIGDLFNRHSVLVFLALFSLLATGETLVRKPLALVGLALVLFFGMASVAKVYFPRHLVPAIPALDCLIAVGLWAATRRTSTRTTWKRTVIRSILPIVVAFSVAGGGSLLAVRSTVRQTRLTDNRTLAYQWITGNVPPGTRILYEAYCPQLYFSGRFEIGYMWTISEIPFEEVMRDYDYVVVSETQWRRYGAMRYRTYEPLFKLSPVREWASMPGKSSGPTIRIYSTAREAGS